MKKILIAEDDFSFLKTFFRERLKILTKKMPDLRLSNDDLLGLSKKIAELDCINDLKSDFFTVAKESLYDNAYWVSDASCIADLIKLYSKTVTQEDRERITETVCDIVDNHLDDDDAQHLSDELSSLEELEGKFNFDLREQIENVQEMLSLAEENAPQEDDYEDDRYQGHGGDQSLGNDALADMFSTLIR